MVEQAARVGGPVAARRHGPRCVADVAGQLAREPLDATDLLPQLALLLALLATGARRARHGFDCFRGRYFVQPIGL